MEWNNSFARRMALIKRSPIRELLKLTDQPDMISFAGGLPAPELFPLERIREATTIVLTRYGSQALQYSTTEGMLELRRFLAQRLSSDVLQVHPDNILITTGSQQALDLIARALLDERDQIVVENPTYLGMLQACKPYDLTYLPAMTDQDGLLIEPLPDLLRKKPKLLYVVPNYQNPQGSTLSTERRLELVSLLDEYPVPLIEDNPYGELRYTGSIEPTLMELDAQRLGIKELNGRVIYTGTFSKILSPGLRVGWVAAPLEVINKLIELKQGMDLHSSTLTQYITYEVVRDNFLEQHIATLCTVYRDRRDHMLAAMENYFPTEVTWSHPDGGLFLMVHMPEHLDAEDLLAEALTYKVAFVPGIDFHIGNVGRNTFRLNFSNATPQLIDEGIKRLGQLLKSRI